MVVASVPAGTHWLWQGRACWGLGAAVLGPRPRGDPTHGYDPAHRGDPTPRGDPAQRGNSAHRGDNAHRSDPINRAILQTGVILHTGVAPTGGRCEAGEGSGVHPKVYKGQKW